MLREWLRAAVIPAALVGLAGAAGPPSPRTPTEEPPAAPGSHPLPAGVIARIGTRLYGGGLSPHFSHDGKQIAVTTGYVARVLDIATGRERFSDQINPTNIGGPAVVRFAMSGDVIAACAPHGQPVHVWRIAPNGTVTGPMKYIPPDHRDPPAGLPTHYAPAEFAVSDDGSRVAVAWSNRLQLIDPATGKVVADHRLVPHREQPIPALSADGRRVALGTGPGIQLLDAESGKELDSWESRSALSPRLAVSGDGSVVVAFPRAHRQGEPSLVLLRHLRTKTTEELPKDVGGPALEVAISPAGDRIAVVPRWGFTREVVVWDVAGKKVLRRLALGARSRSAGFSADGRVLAVCDEAGVIGLWDVETGKLVPGSADPPATVRRLLYADGGRRLAAFAGTWVAWDLPAGRPSDALAAAGTADELSPDGRLTATHITGRLTVADARTGEAKWSAEVPEADRFFRVRFAPDGAKLVTRGEKAVALWDAATGKRLTEFPVEPGQSLLAVSPDARRVVVGSRHPKGGIFLGTKEYAGPLVVSAYDTATGERVWTGDPPACIPYPSPISPDGRFLAYEAETRFDRGGGGPTGVVVRDLATGRVLWRTDEKVYAYSMAFAPDGELLALGRHEGAVSVYEVRTGKPVWEFKHADRVTGLAFAPDGMTLAAASPDAPVFLWDVYGTRTRAGPAPTPAAVDRAAAELGAADPAAAFRAVRTLHAAPAEAVRAIRAAVKPVAAPDPATVRQLIAELDSPDFATRERAERELTRRVALVGDAVAEALRTETEPEPRARLMRVMSAAGRPQPDDLRGVRAVGVLARVGAAEAAAVLRELAGGAKGSPVTRAAAAALERAPK